MKNLITLLLIAFVVQVSQAQCNTFYNVKDGTTIVQETYDKKDRKTGTIKSTYSDFANIANGFTATMNVESYDDKEELLAESEVDVRCENGIFYMDMRNFLNSDQMKQYENMEMTIEAEELEIPSSLSVGQELDDASITMTGQAGPMKLNFTTKIINRKVVGRKPVKTPAGEFECFKMTYDMESKFGMKMVMSVVEYWAEGYGPVKSRILPQRKVDGLHHSYKYE